MAENTMKTRLQLKTDTEENWNKAINFIPKKGELIIYSADTTHPSPRFKVGDGLTTIINLSFVGLVQSYEQSTNFPQMGNIGNIYIDEKSNELYYFSRTGYKLLNTKYSYNSQNILNIISWNPGILTRSSVNNGVLTIENGEIPTLQLNEVSVITSFN